MTTTIYPVMDGGPDDEGYGPQFPASTGMGMLAQLREAGFRFPKPKKEPKKFIHDAEGSRTAGPRGRLKASSKPENLRVKRKKKKLGPFGEAYQQPPGNAGKGVRVSESRRFHDMRENFRRRFKAWRKAIERRPMIEDEDEVTPPGREEQVRKLKKNPNISNPWAVAWASYNKSKD